MEERIYTIPLRREFQKTTRFKKAKKAVTAVKEFTLKHSKAKEVKVGRYLNEAIWANGIRYPPARVKVKITKENDIATVELIDAPVVEKKTTETKKVKEEIKKEVEKEVEEELEPEMGKKVAKEVAKEVVEESEKEITKNVPKKKSSK
ncbi:60S ribosomal protein L31 [Candidatus Woesearchaeota archaeon]|nr:60S ribosomal protein L31 [Candidatus Woesearchaeota archaeon]